MRTLRVTAGLIAWFSAVAMQAQAQTPALPQFEVASIKPSPPEAARNGSGGHSGKGRIAFTNYTLKRCIMGAYGLGQNEIVGGPDWLDQEGYDIQAKAEGSVGDEVLMKMLQTLLADRFKLALHRENKTIGVYVMGIAKNGLKLEKAEPGESSSGNGQGHLEGRNITMAGLAWRLGRKLDRPVIDRTGLQGEFNYKLEWTPESAQAAKAAERGVAAELGTTVFVAIQQQLGLKLEPQKAPVEVLVIDHAEKPTEN